MRDAEGNVDIMLGDPRRAVLSMFFPLFIALLIGQLNAFVDAVWCSSLGMDAMSAISLCSSLYFITVGVGNGIGIGANVASSHTMDWIYWGLVAGEAFGGTLMMLLAQWQFGMKRKELDGPSRYSA